MTDLHYSEGRWIYDFLHGWQYYPPGGYEPAIRRDPTITLDDSTVRQLIAALDEAGWIVPRLDERLRAEDLKITYRLLDLLKQKWERDSG